MKYIPIKCCGVCPNNRIHICNTLTPGDWVDYCKVLGKVVKPNGIDEDCPLEDLKNESD